MKKWTNSFCNLKIQQLSPIPTLSLALHVSVPSRRIGFPLPFVFYLSKPFLGLALSFRLGFFSLELRMRSSGPRTFTVTHTFAFLRGWPLFERAEPARPAAADSEAGVVPTAEGSVSAAPAVGSEYGVM